jgi:serine/threonine protein kinase
MLDPDGTVRVLDLGLARIIDAGNALDSRVAGRLTQTGIYMGTIDYMAPEQGEDSHNVDHRADIYSLACTFYFLLTGREPFPGPTILRRMVAHQDHPAPSLRTERPDIAPALEAAYLKMMAKKPAERPASMAEVIALLHAARRAGGDPASAAAESPEPRPAPAVNNQRQTERRGSATTTVGSTIFARLAVEEETIFDRELNVRDLAIDVRSEAAGTDVVGTDRDEIPGSSSEHELNLRELAAELEKEARPTKAPDSPRAAAEPLHRVAAAKEHGIAADLPPRSAAAGGPSKRQSEPPGKAAPSPAPTPPAAATPLPRRTAVEARQPGASPAASNPPTSEHQPPRPTAEPLKRGASPAASNLAAIEKQAPTSSGEPRRKDAPPPAPTTSAAERRRSQPAAAPHSGDSASNKLIPILAVAAVILIVLAIVVSLGRRSTPSQQKESPGPAATAVESESPSQVAPAAPPPL